MFRSPQLSGLSVNVGESQITQFLNFDDHITMLYVEAHIFILETLVICIV